MFTLILFIIYLAFISLGLPDSILGSTWPVMRNDLGMPLSAAGIVSVLVSSGTIVSSFLSGKMTGRFGSGKVTLVSVLMTAVSLLGFSFSTSFSQMCLFAIPLGLGAGAVDSALNNFVALHYNAKHMSWLHCFWGIGATAGPLIMSGFLVSQGGWRQGYFVITIVQFSLSAVLLIALPLWRRVEGKRTQETGSNQKVGHKHIFSIPIVKTSLLSFFCYCAIEMTTGLWGSSYLVAAKGLSADLAAKWVSFFYLGITLGRLLTGFLSIKWQSRVLIRIGQAGIVFGILFFLLPLDTSFQMIGFILVGLGCAPIFPCMLHDTPTRVGKELSSSLMGIQMAFAYLGSTVMPPIFGLLAGGITTSVFPFFLAVIIVLMIVSTEKTNRLTQHSSIIHS